MAYNDYGAFVYLNGTRQPDYEDVPIFGERDTDLAPGHRIYANLMRQLACDSENPAEDSQFSWASHCHHGVMGDGKVRIGVYKTGLWGASVYVMKDEATLAGCIAAHKNSGNSEKVELFECVIDTADEIIRRSGHNPVPYPGDDVDGDERQKLIEEHEQQQCGPYLYEFDVVDHHVLFESRDCSVARPSYHARLVCPSGDIWDVFYDSMYGAGLSDCRFGANGMERDEKFNHVDVDRIGAHDHTAWPLSLRLPIQFWNGRESCDDSWVNEQLIAVSEDDIDELAGSLGILPASVADSMAQDHSHDDEDSGRHRILYRSMSDASGDRLPISTLSSYHDDGIIGPETAIKLIQLGIDLARMGVDQVFADNWWWASDAEREGSAYGLDGTAFEGLSYALRSKFMVPSQVRYNEDHPLHDDSKPSEDVIREVFSAYQKECDEADGTIRIDENDLGVAITWPIRDANGVPFSPLMQPTDDGGLSWQVVRRIADNGEEKSEVIGCGWNDEEPFILLGDGEMASPKNWEIVADTTNPENADT